MERKLKDYAILALKGMGMGAADVVPGVSEITFSGKSSRKPYDLEVEGRFVPDDKGKKLFLNCHYQINDFNNTMNLKNSGFFS